MTLRSLLPLQFLVAAALPAADLPIREVTLYKHGVASFDRSGELKPGETVKLDFKPEDMNDVLKSLTITDRNGGKVNGVRYDSSEPLEKRLEDFPFKAGAGTGLAAFLDQMLVDQLLITLQHRERIEPVICGNRPHGGQGVTLLERAL